MGLLGNYFYFVLFPFNLYARNINHYLSGDNLNRPVHGQDCIMGNQDKQYRYGSNPS